MDLIIKDNKNEVEISLSGRFGIKEFPLLKEKLEHLISGPGIFFFINLDRALFLDSDYLNLFLDLLNTVKKKNARLILLFSNPENELYFSRYASVFEIASSKKAFHKTGLLSQLKQAGIYYSKQTGIRLTPSVGIATGILLLGWFLTLFSIIITQNKDLASKRAEIAILEKNIYRSTQEIKRLESSIGSLQHLGLVKDKEELSAFGSIRNWLLYLDRLDSLRREN